MWVIGKSLVFLITIWVVGRHSDNKMWTGTQEWRVKEKVEERERGSWKMGTVWEWLIYSVACLLMKGPFFPYLGIVFSSHPFRCLPQLCWAGRNGHLNRNCSTKNQMDKPKLVIFYSLMWCHATSVLTMKFLHSVIAQAGLSFFFNQRHCFLWVNLEVWGCNFSYLHTLWKMN